MSDVTREKLRKNNFRGGMTGKHQSEKTREKISQVHKGKHKTEEHKRKISEALRGKGSNWRGGVSSLKRKIISSYKYRQWRSDVFTRDSHFCLECGRREELEAHHIVPFSIILRKYKIKTIQEAFGCEELWNINNGKSLCRDCHKLTENYGNKINNLR